MKKAGATILCIIWSIKKLHKNNLGYILILFKNV